MINLAYDDYRILKINYAFYQNEIVDDWHVEIKHIISQKSDGVSRRIERKYTNVRNERSNAIFRFF